MRAAISKNRCRWGGKMLKVLTVDVNNTCSYSCLHCYHKQSNKKGRERISAAELQNLMAPLKEHGLTDIFLSGGEPLLHPELNEIFEAAFNLRLYVSILTSAPPNSGYLAGMLADYPNIAQVRVSIESLQPEVIAYIRNKNDAYRHVITFIESIKERRCFFGISSTVSELNLNEIADIFAFAVRNGAGYLRLSPLVTGNEQENLKRTKHTFKHQVEMLLNRIKFLRSTSLATDFNASGYAWLFDLACPAFSHTAYLFKEKGALWLAPCPYAQELRVKVNEFNVLEAFTRIQKIMLNHNPGKRCFIFRSLNVSPAKLLFNEILNLREKNNGDLRYQFLLGNIITRQLEIFNVGYFPCWRSSPLMLYPIQNPVMA